MRFTLVVNPLLTTIAHHIFSSVLAELHCCFYFYLLLLLLLLLRLNNLQLPKVSVKLDLGFFLPVCNGFWWGAKFWRICLTCHLNMDVTLLSGVVRNRKVSESIYSDLLLYLYVQLQEVLFSNSNKKLCLHLMFIIIIIMWWWWFLFYWVIDGVIN